MVQFTDAEDVLYGLSTVLGESARAIHPSHLERHVLANLDRLAPEEAESFASALSSVGNFVKSSELRDVAATALPIVGTTVGTVYGGPVGSALGGALGNAAGQAIAAKRDPSIVSGTTPAAPIASREPPSVVQAIPPGNQSIDNSPATPPAAAPQPRPLVQESSGSTAAAQLLSIIHDPALLSSLLSLVLGSLGRTSVALGNGRGEVPVGALMNLVSELASRAAEDAEEILASREAAVPSYLFDDQGCLTCDPANPSECADALLRTLRRTIACNRQG